MGATVTDLKEKIKSLGHRVFENRELFPAILIVAVGVVSFGLGRLSVESSSGISHEFSAVRTEAAADVLFGSSGDQNMEASILPVSTTVASNTAAVVSGEAAARNTSAPDISPTEKKYVGSKNSNKYHLPWCSGALRIAEENKVWFASKEAAEAAGYTPAANCKGL